HQRVEYRMQSRRHRRPQQRWRGIDEVAELSDMVRTPFSTDGVVRSWLKRNEDATVTSLPRRERRVGCQRRQCRETPFNVLRRQDAPGNQVTVALIAGDCLRLDCGSRHVIYIHAPVLSA